MKAIWKGAIGFGLVNIPVKLYSASQPSELDLDMLDKKDESHIRYKRVNEKTGREVNFKDIVKGYKYRSHYIILEDKDFKAASPKKTSLIEISDFVKQEEIDSMFFESPYYLVPEKSGNKAYALLLEALEKSKKAGIGSFVLRNKEHLCVLTPVKKVIVLNTIRYAEEIRDIAELDLPKQTKPKANELKMAMSLIDQLSTTFKPEKFKDTYATDLMKMIKAKANTKGKKKVEEQPEMKVSHRKKDDDIMAQLKASLKRAG